MFRNKTSRRISAAAFLVLFAVWAVIAVSAIRFVREQSVAATQIEPDVQAVFAIRDISTRSRIVAADIEVRSLSREHRHADAAISTEEVISKIARQTIFAGEQVLLPKLTNIAGLASLALQIDPGLRAVAVSFNELIGAGGLILPGDSVDVIAVFDDDVRAAKEAGFVLQGVTVLAVAQKLQSEQSAATQESEDPGEDVAVGLRTGGAAARSVTLAVTPIQAERLVLAERFGILRLLLRPLQADGAIIPPVIPIADVFTAAGATDLHPFVDTVLQAEGQ